MERRKLFSNTATATTRRKLFSDEKVSATKKRLFSDEGSEDALAVAGKEIIVCQDCKKSYYYDGTTTNLICPNCGGLRFNCVTEITDPVEISSNENPIDKVFSEKREELLTNTLGDSDLANGDCNQLGKTAYTCSDCDQVFEADETTPTNVVCPKCGGTRVELQSQHPNNIGEGEPSEVGEFLKLHQGECLDKEAVELELIERGILDEVGGIQGLIDAGYVSEVSEKEIAFSEVASMQHKLFSDLVTSVSKKFSLIPIQDKESAIESLSGRLSEKCMSALRKANRVEEYRLDTVNFSDKDYINDSGISNDLSAEYGGTSMKLRDFMSILASEYPDAPDDIVDLLVNDKVIKITGSKVEIKK